MFGSGPDHVYLLVQNIKDRSPDDVPKIIVGQFALYQFKRSALLFTIVICVLFYNIMYINLLCGIF